MSRNKKSRKPSAFDINPIREERKVNTTVEPRKARKTKGKKPGNRQQEAVQSKGTKGQTNNANKDPRLGNKTPILLTPSAAKPKTVKSKENTPALKPEKKAVAASPIAKIKVVEADDSLQQELYAIEDDAQLQQILAKQEDDISLTEEEVNYFNEKMERHQQLSELLGLTDEDDAESESTEVKTSADEDDLWDKLDSSDLSKFE